MPCDHSEGVGLAIARRPRKGTNQGAGANRYAWKCCHPVLPRRRGLLQLTSSPAPNCILGAALDSATADRTHLGAWVPPATRGFGRRQRRLGLASPPDCFSPRPTHLGAWSPPATRGFGRRQRREWALQSGITLLGNKASKVMAHHSSRLLSEWPGALHPHHYSSPTAFPYPNGGW